MITCLPECFFEELSSKLNATGLPEHQVRSFVERYREYQVYDPSSFNLFKNHQIPSDDCFKTLAEAQKIFSADINKSEYTKELDFISRYLEVPYSTVVATKQEMTECFACSSDDIEDAYYQSPEWLFITVDTVKPFADFLHSKFHDSELIWSIYKKAAPLGLEKTQYRINRVLEILGPVIGEEVIRNDLQEDAWLFYLWFTDPVGCIEYMRERGMTPEKILNLLKHEPRFLFEYKEDRKLKYLHDQEYIDYVINKYVN